MNPILAVLAAATQRGHDGERDDLAFLGRLTLVFLGVTFLIEWADPTKSDRIVVNQFGDQVAVELPSSFKPGDMPNPMMGGPGERVHIMQWRAAFQHDMENGGEPKIGDLYPYVHVDVYPDEVAGQPAMGGYQLGVAMDIFRGRYRESLETPNAIAPDAPLAYTFALPTANHAFLPGHRIMVQVQSSWFPLYDRNPQTFVPNIFWATPADYRKAVQRVYHAPGQASFIELPIVKAP